MRRIDDTPPPRLAGNGASETAPRIGGLKKPDQNADGPVQEALKESFPASDPPSFAAAGVERDRRAANDREKKS